MKRVLIVMAVLMMAASCEAQDGLADHVADFNTTIPGAVRMLPEWSYSDYKADPSVSSGTLGKIMGLEVSYEITSKKLKSPFEWKRNGSLQIGVILKDKCYASSLLWIDDVMVMRRSCDFKRSWYSKDWDAERASRAIAQLLGTAYQFPVLGKIK